jgi:hypothetical protein
MPLTCFEWRVWLLMVLVAVPTARATLTGETCTSGADQAWTYSQWTLTTAASPGFCLTALLPPTPYYLLAMLPCGGASAPWQNFSLLPNNTIVLSSIPAQCVNLAAYGTAPGTQVWLADCATGGCRGNCDWERGPGNAFVNSESKLVRSGVPCSRYEKCPGTVFLLRAVP